MSPPARRLLTTAAILVLAACAVAGCSASGEQGSPTTPATLGVPEAAGSSPGAPTTAAPVASTAAEPAATADPGPAPPVAGDLTGVDPCGLLDPATIETSLGSAVSAGTRSDAACVWAGLDDPSVVAAVALPASPVPTVEEHCQQLREFDTRLAAVEDIDGMGNRAWSRTVPGGSSPDLVESAVTVCLDQGVVIVGLTAATDEATLAAANRQLADAVLARL